MEISLDRDRVGGLSLIALGVLATYVAITWYPLGTPQRMGPGMFPAGLGILLVFLGALQFLLTLGRPVSSFKIRVYSPLFVLGGIAAFALMIVPFGLVPAIAGVIVVSSMAELRFRIFDITLLIVGLSLLAPFIFSFCLGIPIDLFSWPF